MQTHHKLNKQIIIKAKLPQNDENYKISYVDSLGIYESNLNSDVTESKA